VTLFWTILDPLLTLTPCTSVAVDLMGWWFQRAGTGKNKKVLENSPCWHFSLKGPKSENLKNSYLLSDMANFDYNFCFE